MNDVVVSTRLPPGWRIAPLSTVVAEVSGGFSVNCEDRAAMTDEIGVLKTGAVAYGFFDPSQNKYVIPAEHKRVRTRVSAGSIIFCRKNSEEVVGACALVEHDQPNLFLSDLLWELRPNRDVSPRWLEALMQSHAVASVVRLRATGTQASMKNISQDRLLSIEVPIPPSKEQYAIAEILRTWDEAIDACKRQRNAKAKALTAARQRVYGLDGSPPAKWPSAKLEGIVDRIRRQSDGGNHPVMTISGKSGFKRQDEKFDRFMAGDSVDRYLLLTRGEFAYNKGNSKTYPQGCIYRLEQDTALVPFVYFAFALRDGLNSDFYAHLFEAGYLNHQLSRLINSGVRNDGLLNIYADDFFGCIVPVPPEPEQERIAAFFYLAKQEIVALDKRIDALRMQKRGLMQKLLSGEWRVKVDKEAAA